LQACHAYLNRAKAFCSIPEISINEHGTKRAIIIGNSMCVVGLVLLAFQTRIWHLYLGIGVILGLGISIGGMLAMMTVINNWFIMKRSAAFSICMASMGFSGLFLNPTMMALIGTVGWRKTYLILAIVVEEQITRHY
jgi:MFS family permease